MNFNICITALCIKSYCLIIDKVHNKMNARITFKVMVILLLFNYKKAQTNLNEITIIS